MKRLIWSLVALVLLAPVALATPVAAAGPGPAGPPRFTCTSGSPDFAGLSSYKAAGRTEHMSGWTATYTATGDSLCAGSVEVVARVEVTPGRGVVQGTVVYRLDALDGGWTGRFVQQWAFPDATTYGWEVASGFGALEGWQLRGVLVEALDGSIVETDYAFQPGG